MLMRNNVPIDVKRVCSFGAGAFYHDMMSENFRQDQIEVVRLFDDTVPAQRWEPELYGMDSTIPEETLFCVGYGQMPLRLSRLLQLCGAGMDLVTWVSRHAVLSALSNVGNGCIIDHGTIIGARAKVGLGCYLGMYSTVEHDSQIGRACYFASHVHLNGRVTIGDGVFVGSGAHFRDGISVGDGAVIGMGAMVLSDIPPRVVAYGNPARVVREL